MHITDKLKAAPILSEQEGARFDKGERFVYGTEYADGTIDGFVGLNPKDMTMSPAIRVFATFEEAKAWEAAHPYEEGLTERDLLPATGRIVKFQLGTVEYPEGIPTFPQDKVN